jgi:hypothetical protein
MFEFVGLWPYSPRIGISTLRGLWLFPFPVAIGISGLVKKDFERDKGSRLTARNGLLRMTDESGG